MDYLSPLALVSSPHPFFRTEDKRTRRLFAFSDSRRDSDPSSFQTRSTDLAPAIVHHRGAHLTSPFSFLFSLLPADRRKTVDALTSADYGLFPLHGNSPMGGGKCRLWNGELFRLLFLFFLPPHLLQTPKRDALEFAFLFKWLPLPIQSTWKKCNMRA